MKKISVIIPCYNEEGNIPLFYDAICKLSEKMNYVGFEFLFIDDGSNDNTLAEFKKIAAMDKRVRYISFSRNFGKEAALYAGFENCTGDYAVAIDVDMQHPPEKLIEMYEYIQKGYECVALCTKEHNDYPFFRKVFTKLWYKVISTLSSVEQMPGASDYRLMSRKMIDAIVRIKEYNRYSKGIFSFAGFKTKWLEYTVAERANGETKWSFLGLFKYALEGIVAFSTTPLVISAILGMLLCFASFLAIIYIIVRTLIFGDPAAGWPSMACIVVFMGGLQLFFAGILGLYLSKIYLEVKNRPKYIVVETEEDSDE